MGNKKSRIVSNGQWLRKLNPIMTLLATQSSTTFNLTVLNFSDVSEILNFQKTILVQFFCCITFYMEFPISHMALIKNFRQSMEYFVDGRGWADCEKNNSWIRLFCILMFLFIVFWFVFQSKRKKKSKIFSFSCLFYFELCMCSLFDIKRIICWWKKLV